MTGRKLRKSNIDRFNGRPGGTGLDQNPLHRDLSGDGESFTNGSTSAPTGLAGAIETIATLAATQGLAVADLRVAHLAPHPMNNPERSLPQPGNPKWEELVESVRENGVRLPGLAVTKEAFVKARPGFVDRFNEATTHIMVYAHRRRAAALEAGQLTMPMIVDDSVLDGGGDLDAMTWENWGREDLDPIALAHQFAIYSEDLGLGQRGIATRLGISQPTVQRHLALMLLVDEAHDMLRKQRLPLVAAADLASKLPFGPRRRWQDQKRNDPGQDTPERAEEQRAALALIAAGSTAELAISRVIAERRALATAASLDIEIVDPAKRFGADAERHRLSALPDNHAEISVVAAVDAYTGGLAYYTAEAPPLPAEPAAQNSADISISRPGDDTHNDDVKHRAEAQKARRRVAAQLAVRGTSRDRLGIWLTTQFRWRIRASDNPRAWALAHKWLGDAALAEAATVTAWQEAIQAETDPKIAQRAIWAVSVAASELRASEKGRSWDGGDVAYLEILRESEGFTPTEWEAQQVRSLQAAS